MPPTRTRWGGGAGLRASRAESPGCACLGGGRGGASGAEPSSQAGQKVQRHQVGPRNGHRAAGSWWEAAREVATHLHQAPDVGYVRRAVAHGLILLHLQGNTAESERRVAGLHRTCSPGGRAVGSLARGSQAVRQAQGQRPVSRAISGPQHSPPRLHGRRALARLQALISRVSLQGAGQQRPCLAVTGGGGANNPGVRQGTPDSGRRGDSPKVTRARKAEPDRIDAVSTSQPAFCLLLLKVRSFPGSAWPGKDAHHPSRRPFTGDLQL